MTTKGTSEIHEFASSQGVSRRTLVKAGLGAIAAPAVLRAIPANAQSRVIKIGHVSPRTGPLAGFGEADGFILEQVRGILAKGLQSGGRTYQVADHQQGQPVQRQPRRRGRVRADPRRQGRSHRRLRDARHDQSGGRPGRGQRGALHHHQLPLAAVLLRTQGRSGQGLHLDLSLLLGPGGRHRRVPRVVGSARRPTRSWAACSPTTPTATPGAIRSAACRRRWRRPATSSPIPAAISS